MSNAKILEKAVNKAMTNGWSLAKVFGNKNVQITERFSDSFSDSYMLKGTDGWSSDMSLRDIIFNHGFAKSFWGSEMMLPDLDPAWKHHLQQMVLKENPITYLKKFLKEKEK